MIGTMVNISDLIAHINIYTYIAVSLIIVMPLEVQGFREGHGMSDYM